MVPIDALPTRWELDEGIQTLMELRTAQLETALGVGGAGVFLLIDPMLGDPVLTEVPPASMIRPALNTLRSSAWERPTHALQLPAPLNMDAAFAPYLVELQGTQDSHLQHSVQWALRETLQTWVAEPEQPTPHRVGGWLQSAAQGDVLAEVLSGWLQLSAAGAGRASYLRLADRRVLGLTAHVLGQAGMAQALHPVQRWHWIDPHASLQVLQASASPHVTADEAAGGDSAHRPFVRFSQAQWAQMALGPQVHHAMAQAIGQHLRSDRPTAPAQWQPVGTAQWQAALVQVQSRHGQLR